MSGPGDPFDEMERFFDQLTQFGTAAGGDVRVDVVDEGDTLVVVADLPGYGTEGIDVQLHRDRELTLSAVRETGREAGDDDYVRRERTTESASRTVRLPEPVEADSAEASYDDGVLTVRLEKQTAAGQGTDIPVN